MPHYHLHLETHDGPAGDIEDRELPNDAAALHEAKTAAIEALQDAMVNEGDNPRAIVRLGRKGGELLAVIKLEGFVDRKPALQ